MNNSILVIRPYLYENLWVFDDPDKGLVREAFISGATEIIDLLLHLAKIPKEEAQKGFPLLFSAEPFPGYQAHFIHDGEEYNGNWYKHELTNRRGWLCPALLKYFPTVPQNLYALTLKPSKDS